MANIINGTDTGSGGLITTGDSSDELQLQTAETARVTLTNTAVVVNEGGNDVDFRVEGDTDANLLFVDAGNDRVGVKTSSPAVAFDVVGQVRASTGILFGTDTAAANALDDYEEGTWTPSLLFGGASVSMTYTQQTGVYTKVGNIVTVNFTIVLSNKGSSTGSATIAGFPFTPNVANSAFPLYTDRITATNGGVGLFSNASTTFTFYQLLDGSNGGSMANTAFANDSFVTGFFTYRVA